MHTSHNTAPHNHNDSHNPLITDEDQATTINWLIDNRRPGVSREEALKTLRWTLVGNPVAKRLIEGMIGN